jgi:SAM-dependent methyltransferase
MTTLAKFDPKELEAKVKAMYRSVAEEPHGEFHFEMGRKLAERLGYASSDLDKIPPESIESFAGVGYYFHLAALKEGETVVDLGSGSGMDTFVAALKVGARGKVIGIDMTDEQRAKAERLRDRDGFRNVTYLKGYIEAVPLPDASADVVISNGVVNLATDKRKVFDEAARLKRGGRLALSDIVTEVQLPKTSCAIQRFGPPASEVRRSRTIIAEIEAAGLKMVKAEDNPPINYFGQCPRSQQEIRREKHLTIGDKA